jgi:hypothetical protein
VEKFSRRTAEIERVAMERGITDPEEKARLGAVTRAKKDESLSVDDLVSRWDSRLTEREREWLFAHVNHASPSPGDAVASPGRERPRTTPDHALDYAIRHVFERKSVETAPRILAQAMTYAVGDVHPKELWEALERYGGIVERETTGPRAFGQQRLLTTREVLEEERAMLRFAVEGKGACVPLGRGIGGNGPNDASIQYEVGSVTRAEGFELNRSQHQAVSQLISSRDRVQILRGGAGTGKTTLLREAAAAIAHGGNSVFACALTGDASRRVLREAGFDKAEILQKLLTDRSMQERVRGGVIWVDEAGMVGTPTMRRLFDLAERTDARVILAGDGRVVGSTQRNRRASGLLVIETIGVVSGSGDHGKRSAG